MSKRKVDKQKLAARIIAGVLVGIMVFGGLYTLLAYVFTK